MEQLTEKVQIRYSPSLLKKARDQAQRRGLSLSAFVRYVTSLYCDPDGETLRLVDSKETYEVEK